MIARKDEILTPTMIRQSAQHLNPSYSDTVNQATDAQTGIAAYPCTDAGNAEWFAHLYADTVRYDHRRERWLAWNGTIWADDAIGRVYQLAKDAARQRAHAAIDHANLMVRNEHEGWARASESRSRLDSTLRLAMTEPALADKGDIWDTQPFLLAHANGVIDLTTGYSRPGQPNDYITQTTRIAYDPDATAPRWERFLLEIFESDTEMVDWVQRAVGYSLTGDTREQCLFILHGSGSNGKSVFLNSILTLLGDYGTSTRFSTLEAQKRNSSGATPEVAALVGKRFVTASEVNESSTWDEARVKSLTGGDAMTARPLYKAEFEFRPQAKFWVALNSKPKANDDSDGFWRRVRLIPFLAKFRGDQADKTLQATLYAELPGILNWAIRGCLDWQTRGLDPAPQAVSNAVAQYREDSDPVAGFLAECCVAIPDAWTSLADLQRAYDRYTAQEGIPITERLTRNLLSRRLEARYQKKRGAGGVGFVGVAFRTDDQPVASAVPNADDCVDLDDVPFAYPM